MTEQEWLECQNPKKVLDYLSGKVTESKFRLLGCACCRQIWHLIPDERSRKAVEVAELFAVGAADLSELLSAYMEARSVSADHMTQIAVLNTADSVGNLAWGAAAVVGNAAYAATRARIEEAVRLAEGRIPHPQRLWTREVFDGALERERQAYTHLLRDIFGNPFRPVPSDPSWRTGAVTALARAAYDERHLPEGTLDATRLAVLADALEEAGCDAAELLAHLRGPGPHVRGCWALDLVLGRE